MADVHEREVVRGAADVVNNVVAGFGLQRGAVALDARGVKQPVLRCGQAGGVGVVLTQRVAVIVIVGDARLRGIFLAQRDELLFAGDGLRHLLGKRLCFRFRLVGDVGVVALHVGVGVEERAVAHAVIVVGVRRVFLGDLLRRVGQAVLIVGGVVSGKLRQLKILPEVLLVAARAVDVGQVAVGAAEVAELGVHIQVIQRGVDLGLLLLGERRTVGDSRVIDRVGAHGGFETFLGQVIRPGDALLFIIILLAQRRVGVDDVGVQVAVLVLKRGLCALEEVVDHSGGELMRADDGGGGVGSKIAARQHGEENDQRDEHCDRGDDQRGLETFAHAGLFTGGLLRSRGCPALFLFAGCAHNGIIPLIFRVFRSKSGSAHIIANPRRACK